jgi:hypothetical protein
MDHGQNQRRIIRGPLSLPPDLIFDFRSWAGQEK